MAESWENPRGEQKTPVVDRYARAGVDIAAGNEAVAHYRRLLGQWRHADQLDAVGGFAGLFRLPGDSDRVLVASTDGVGTKVLIASELGRFDSVGADLVNHCVNDILVCNATPLFFLDYLAVGKLDAVVAAAIVGAAPRPAEHTTARCLGAKRPRCPDSTGGIISTSRGPSSVPSSDKRYRIPRAWRPAM